MKPIINFRLQPDKVAVLKRAAKSKGISMTKLFVEFVDGLEANQTQTHKSAADRTVNSGAFAR